MNWVEGVVAIAAATLIGDWLLGRFQLWRFNWRCKREDAGDSER